MHKQGDFLVSLCSLCDIKTLKHSIQMNKTLNLSSRGNLMRGHLQTDEQDTTPIYRGNLMRGHLQTVGMFSNWCHIFKNKIYHHKFYLFKLCSKKQPIIQDSAAFTYHIFKIHDDFKCTL